MNVTNMDPNIATGEDDDNKQKEQGNTNPHGYNIYPRPVRPQEKYNILQTGQQSAHAEHTNCTHTYDDANEHKRAYQVENHLFTTHPECKKVPERLHRFLIIWYQSYIPMKMHKTGYSNSRGFSVYTGERS